MYKIRKLDEQAVENAEKKWNSIAKPLHSLGVFEDIVKNIAGIQGTQNIDIKKRCVLVMCADNGVVCEGVTQTGQEVTAVVTENFAKGATSVCAMARNIGADVVPIDVGVARDVDGVVNKKISYGTKNMLHEKAMTYEQAKEAVQVGIDCVKELSEKGYKIIVTGEMGIGNTTTSSAVASVLMDQPVETMTGRGAGLTSEGLNRKVAAIKKAIELNRPDPADPVDVLAKVGGLDIAGMAGVFLGGAALHMPVLMDGFISCVAALIAMKLCPTAGDYILASHVSKEPAAHLILEHMGKEAILHADMCLGEGTGAVTLFPVLDMAAAVYHSMSTFEDIHVEQYEELK